MQDFIRERVFVTGHRGLVGSAIERLLRARGCEDIVTADRDELDLRDMAAVQSWFANTQPKYVFHCAGRVGGILANSTAPADFLHDNLMIHATVLRAARDWSVRKLLYLGSSCLYPRDCEQPIREESLLTGPLEQTNEGYAIAKIAGVKACDAYRMQYGCNFISAMPTNLYGPGDHFDLQTAHVLPALIRKFHEAQTSGSQRVTVWGTGTPRREFLHVDDLATACLTLMEQYDSPGPINVGTGEDMTVGELAELIRDLIAPKCEIRFDPSQPDGMPRKRLDVSRIRSLGWTHRIPLVEGIQSTYRWYLDNCIS